MDILDTRPNLTSMVLCHDQQIKDLAAHLLELKQLITPMMEFKKREWVGLTDEEQVSLWADRSDGPSNAEIKSYYRTIEATLRSKNK